MRAVLQRVKSASVIADGVPTANIGKGLYILLGVENGDTRQDAELLAAKIGRLRIFSDDCGKMNLSVTDIDGEICVVSNFTLLASYSHGNRPDYLAAAKPDLANELYGYFVDLISAGVRKCETGVFGSDMESQIVTDGPVTIVMESSALYKNRK